MSTESQVEYRMIPGRTGYRVGSDGSVWSCWRHGPNPVLTDNWHQLKPSKGKHGHLRVTLMNPKSYCCVHQLVLFAFVGPCPDGMEVCHFPDRNPANNALTNLRYGTRQDNYADSQLHGTAPKGTSHGNAKMNDDRVRECRADHATGNYSLQKLADKYGVSKKAIMLIVSRRAWKHVT